VAGDSRPRWGWHRLADPFARSLVDRAGVGAGDLILDLGAGDGAITRHLVATGARVIAFELHPDRARRLRTDFAGADVKVVRADVADLRLPGRPFHVVANPPFDGVSAVLRRLTSPGSRLVRADLIVPLSTGLRWATRTEARHHAFRVVGFDRLPRSAFSPRPRIDCCIITLAPR